MMANYFDDATFIDAGVLHVGDGIRFGLRGLSASAATGAEARGAAAFLRDHAV